MSDLVQVAIVGGLVTLLTPVINHVLGRRDRALASDVVRKMEEKLASDRKVWATERAQLVAEVHRCGGTLPTGIPEVLP